MRDAQYFNGIKFVNRGDGYYEAIVENNRILMHRYVWTYYNGEIPEGYVIHHKDEDRSNNVIDNLQCLSNSEHSFYHGTHKSKERLDKDIETLKKSQIKAAEWHRSEEGRRWHSENSKQAANNGLLNPIVTYVCENCGKEFKAVKRAAEHKCCSGKCYQQLRRRTGMNNETRICAICGKEFIADKYDKRKKTCGRSCGMRLAHQNNPGNWRSTDYKGSSK